MAIGDRIYRYELDAIGLVKTFEIPLPATVVAVAQRKHKISIWALVDPESKKNKIFQAVAMPTRMEVPEGYQIVTHLGTAIVGEVKGGGSAFTRFEPACWTFHVFEVEPEQAGAK